eukprot:TRINITY_DN18876_c0_g1_i2.p2 TRINITY_DN18876_c0_g1~~TRINITY_DN18876_c0_g1_i2.p2  ORF type:complete len:124 (+),score=18.68 TRINITY_DN18876_c0_g1_i2:371-742(+)
MSMPGINAKGSGESVFGKKLQEMRNIGGRVHGSLGNSFYPISLYETRCNMHSKSLQLCVQPNKKQLVLRKRNVRNGAELPIPLKCKLRVKICLLYTSPSPRDLSTSRMPSSACKKKKQHQKKK